MKYDQLHQTILEDEGNPYIKEQMDKMTDQAIGVRISEVINEVKNTRSKRKTISKQSKLGSPKRRENPNFIHKNTVEIKDNNNLEQIIDSNILPLQRVNDTEQPNFDQTPGTKTLNEDNNNYFQNIEFSRNYDNLDDSISMTERLDDVKEVISKDVDQVKFRLKEVSADVDSINKKLDELSKYFIEENKARSAEIYNLVSELQENKSDRLSAYTQSQVARFNSVGKEKSLKNLNDSQELLIFHDIPKNFTKSKKLENIIFNKKSQVYTARNTSEKGSTLDIKSAIAEK